MGEGSPHKRGEPAQSFYPGSAVLRATLFTERSRECQGRPGEGGTRDALFHVSQRTKKKDRQPQRAVLFLSYVPIMESAEPLAR